MRELGSVFPRSTVNLPREQRPNLIELEPCSARLRLLPPSRSPVQRCRSRQPSAAMTALPYPPGGVPWHRKPVAVKDVRRLTGLEPSELLRRPNTQRLTRVDERGAPEECLRVPVELLSKEPMD